MKYILPLLTLFAAFVLSASAQNETISAVMTWGALSYVPPTYKGRVLPTAGTPIVAALELLDGEKIINLSSAPISWLLDGKLIDSGVGKKTAERLIVEMRDRLQDVHIPDTRVDSRARSGTGVSRVGDAISALVALGYKPQEASRHVHAVAADDMSSEDIIREALKASLNK